MIRTLRALFLARLLREKILLVAFVLVIAVLWLASLAGRIGVFLVEERHATSALAEQSRWLANRDSVEKVALQALRAFKPEQTLDSTRLLAAIQSIATDCGLSKPIIGQPEEMPTPEYSVHTFQFTVNKVDYPSLVGFCLALQKRAPYIGVEQFVVVGNDSANPGLLNATMKISSVEISRETH